MKENINSDNESEENNNISNNSEVIDFFLKEKEPSKSLIKEERISIEKEEEEEEQEQEEIEINLEEVQFGSKIICPEDNCFLNAIIDIEPITFKIRSICGENHKKKMKILNFAAKAGKLKEEKESCFICNTTYKDLEEKKNKLYRCYCGKNICENCKKNHLKEKDLENHNMVEFSKKDYSCCCKKSNKKFICFCFDCNKNLCILCNEEHKGHIIKNFNELFQLTKEEKKGMKKKLEKQKEKIDKIKIILDNWLIRTKKCLENYKKNLDLYWEINNIIFNKYNSSKKFYEEIKNIENIRDDFDEHFISLLKSENDLKKQNDIILKLLNENENNIIIRDKKEEKVMFNLERIGEKKLSGEVRNLCELKRNKENYLVVNVSIAKERNIVEELDIYKKSENNIYDQIYSIFTIEGGKILSLSELKNGNLLLVQRKYFKIIDIEKETDKKIIQNQNFELISIIQIIELINGNLVSISYNPNEGSNVIIWEKNLIKDLYEKKLTKSLTKIPGLIMELNQNSFLIYFNEGIISIYNLKTNKINNCTNISKTPNEIQKMIKINEGNILFIFKKCALIYNIFLNQISKIYIINFECIDICKIPNYNIYFSNISEKGKFGLIHLYFDFFLQKLDLGESIFDIHTNEITCLKLINDSNLVTGSLDKSMKIWKIKKRKIN